MKIKLLSKQLELIKVPPSADGLEPKLVGRAAFFDNEIHFSTIGSFTILLHELYHFWLHRTGQVQEIFEKESICSTSASFIETIMLENSSDVFVKLREFANE